MTPCGFECFVGGLIGGLLGAGLALVALGFAVLAWKGELPPKPRP